MAPPHVHLSDKEFKVTLSGVRGGFCKTQPASVMKKVEESYLFVVYPSNYHHLMNPRIQ